jgi:dienelactone hydrolase
MSRLLADWDHGTFTAAGFSRHTYRRGSGPGVIVIHEIPGITPAVIRFADDVVERGFTVVLPDLVGTAGKPVSPAYLARSAVRMCVAREFTTWALDRTSPIVAWLRALARRLHGDAGGPGVGAVGMCFSGGFALAMMVDDTMVAPVLSQPSLPFARGRGAGAGNLGLSPGDEAEIVRRAAEGCQVLGLRFAGDRLVGDTRFANLRDRLGDAFIAVELPSSTERDHSVLTEQRDDGAVEAVLEFLTDRLR